LGLPLDGQGRPPLELTDIRVTVHRDGDFLGSHHDDRWPRLRNGRLLSFVYWFHAQPRAFEGGGLVLSGWARHEGDLQPFGPQVDLDPTDDTLVVFPSSTRHELRRVRCQPDELRSARLAIVAFARRSR
ncbi:MAG TPA: 2OG-Fe(II) oxygenase, partial [Acidimicrobiales bacterium]|nr:2OG-Fe(II) oxygenase [Acidimicrobiales bacterium]